MKYFIDTEFIEGFYRPLFGKHRHYIDLISIGIVCEDGRTYYAISNEFNKSDASEWVKTNVISKLPERNINIGDPSVSPNQKSQSLLWKSNAVIADEVRKFFGCWRDQHFWRVGEDIPDIYGYYADYDWVLFCSLFGKMIDLPKGFPMYCKDLKQMLDQWVNGLTNSDFFTHFHVEMPMTFEEKLKLVKSKNNNYPKQEGEHNALADAKWNYELYKFLNQFKTEIL